MKTHFGKDTVGHGTHVHLWGYFQEGSPKKERSIQHVGRAIPWARSLDCTKAVKGEMPEEQWHLLLWAS